MGKNDKNAWLAEVVEDMILYCGENNLLQSREILHEAHRVIVSETIPEECLGKVQNLKSRG
jgi:hypothetical protein